GATRVSVAVSVYDLYTDALVVCGVLTVKIGEIMKLVQPNYRVNKLRMGVMASTALAAMNFGVADLALAQDASMEEVVITGSRIVRRDLEAASPIVTVGGRNFEESSTL